MFFPGSFPGPTVVEKYSALVQDDVDPKEDSIEENIIGEAKALEWRPEEEPQPYYLRVYDISNAGILMSYFAIGMVSRITQTPVQYYLIEYLDASATIYSANNAFHRLPGTMKFLFGMLSDGVSILGYRRKPWLIIGWSGFIATSLWFTSLGSPGVSMTIFLVFFSTCFETLADVCTDTLCVERAHFESDRLKGSLQATGYIFKSAGKIIGAVIGTYLYDNGTKFSLNIADMFLVQALVPIVCMGGVTWGLLEIASSRMIPRFAEQLQEVWATMQLRAVWKPMIFIYIYIAMQVPNAAWSNFLVWGLGFNDMQLGYIQIASAVVGWLGYIIYRTFLFTMSWRRIYIFTTVVAFGFSLLQIMLILRVNVALGIPDVVFAVGDDLIVNLMEIVHVMPYIIMFVMLCPEGAEGTTFALLTTLTSLAGTVGSSIGTSLTAIWDVSNTTLAAGDYSGVLKLTILTSFLQLMPICLVGIIPDNRECHKEEIDRGRSSWWAGLLLALVIAGSLLFTLIINFSLLF